jgi:Bacterial membrane protein YfhO
MARPSKSRLQIKSDYIAAIAVAFAPLVYFWPALREGRALSPDDGVIFNIPLRVTAANLIRSGHIPLWNPYIFCGLPLHGAAQAGLLLPLNWFYLISSPRVATNLMMLATYMFAAVGAYLYSRRAGADIAGAIATSLIWQWCAFMVEQIGHTNILHTAAFLPWLMWAVDGYLATGERKRGFLIVALLALQIFAGHQQTFAYSLLLVSAYALVMARPLPEARKRLGAVAIFIFAGLALAAVQILPTFELLRNSLRANATYEFFGSFSMPPRFVKTFLAPYVFGGGNGLLFRAPYIERPFFGEYAAYTGVLTLMLGAAALTLKRDVRTKFWAVVFVVALVMATGRFMPLRLYEVLYHVPVLNLFRGPTRHLMEVHFALAVLAGRGLTAIRASQKRSLLPVTTFGGAVFLLTILTVTWWRPAEFHLAREIPVSLLRAPELFLPVFIAGLSAASLWIFARSKSRRALVSLFLVLALDLFLYGQGSAWRTHSPGPQDELWQEPETVKVLRRHEPSVAPSSYRILTEDLPFDPSLPVNASADGAGALTLQPDTYMMYGIENAAGYDGFGLSRYSRMTGDMKVWGELTDAEGTLRGDSRALDLLNVRYVLARPRGSAGAEKANFPPAPATYGGQHFASDDLGLRPFKAGRQLSFTVPAAEIDHIALLTNLSWSNEVPDHTVVAQIQLHARDGKTFSFDLRAGDHTSEWAFDRSDIRSQIKHKRAPVATSYPVDDGRQQYQAHTYVGTFRLPAKTVITSGSITVATIKDAPDLSLSVARITLADGENAFPMRRDWITEQADQSPESAAGQRWKKIAEVKDAAIFENTRVLPRVWLANEVKVLTDPEILNVIRTAKFADGKVWDPRKVVLSEGQLDFTSTSPDPNASVEMTRAEPNEVIVKTKSSEPAILVLSANHFPGWRAYVDGKFVANLRLDYNLRGVVLPPGEHTVEFVYWPKSVLIGAVISLLTLIGLVIWWKRLLPVTRLRAGT